MGRTRQILSHHAHDLRELLHQRGLVLEAAGGIDQRDVGTSRDCCLHCVERHRRGVAAVGARDDVAARALAPALELLAGRSTKGVASTENDVAPKRTVTGGQLADRGRLAGAVDAEHQHDVRLGGEGERLAGRLDRSELLRHRRAQHRAHLIRVTTRRFALHAREQVFGRADTEVGPEQQRFELTEHGFVDPPRAEQATQPAHQRLLRPRQALCERGAARRLRYRGRRRLGCTGRRRLECGGRRRLG